MLVFCNNHELNLRGALKCMVRFTEYIKLICKFMLLGHLCKVKSFYSSLQPRKKKENSVIDRILH